jgi:uracil-DNA glycosylase family 4
MDKLAYIKSCKKCQLYKTRRTTVFGRGGLPADILFIGEGPGKTEDLIGQAFIGSAGKLLDNMINEAELNKYRIYFTNVVLCHPTDTFDGSNREPTENEIMQCMSNVEMIIKICSPMVIVCAGDIAFKYYGKTKTCPVVKIQHPAFIHRSGGKASPYYIKNIRALEEIHAILQS